VQGRWFLKTTFSLRQLFSAMVEDSAISLLQTIIPLLACFSIIILTVHIPSKPRMLQGQPLCLKAAKLLDQ